MVCVYPTVIQILNSTQHSRMKNPWNCSSYTCRHENKTDVGEKTLDFRHPLAMMYEENESRGRRFLSEKIPFCQSAGSCVTIITPFGFAQLPGHAAGGRRSRLTARVSWYAAFCAPAFPPFCSGISCHPSSTRNLRNMAISHPPVKDLELGVSLAGIVHQFAKLVCHVMLPVKKSWKHSNWNFVLGKFVCYH